MSTAFAGFSRGYDVIVVNDGVFTPSPYHQSALNIMSHMCCKIINSSQIIEYIHDNYNTGKNGNRVEL